MSVCSWHYCLVSAAGKISSVICTRSLDLLVLHTKFDDLATKRVFADKDRGKLCNHYAYLQQFAICSDTETHVDLVFIWKGFFVLCFKLQSDPM